MDEFANDIEIHLRRGEMLVWAIASAIRLFCRYIPYDTAENIARRAARFAIEVERPLRERAQRHAEKANG